MLVIDTRLGLHSMMMSRYSGFDVGCCQRLERVISATST